MEKMIQHKDLILTAYEYAIGGAPTPQINEKRKKLVAKGEIVLVRCSDDFYEGQTRRIERKR